MKKQMSFVIASLFAFVLFLGVASAVLTTIPDTFGDLSQTSGSFTFNVSSEVNEIVTLKIEGPEGITYSGDLNPFTLKNDTEENKIKEITINYIVPAEFEFDVRKAYTATLEFNGTVSPEKNVTLIFEETTFCKYGEKGDLEIVGIDINNLGSGDDNEWEFLDSIEIEVTVGNTNRDDSISNVEVEILILDKNGKDVTDDFFEDSDDAILDYGKIKDDTEETEITSLKVSPGLNQEDYRIYMKAYKDNSEEDPCIEESDDFDKDIYTEVEVVIGDKEIGIDEFDYPSTIACGASTTISFDFYNFDLADKEEDMRVSLYNNDLGIDVYSDKFDLRKNRDKKLYFDVEIPEGTEAGEYRMKIYYQYDYDEDEDKYDEEELADENFDLVVEGNCYVDLTPTITAEMVSEKAVEGEELIIKSIIGNDDATAMFGVSADGYSTWAELIEVTPQFSNINVDSSQEFIFKFKLNDDSVGEQTFNVVVTSGDKIVSTQAVAVNIEEGSFNLGSLFEGWNWTTIGIVVLNLILIIAIILVARSVLRKR